LFVLFHTYAFSGWSIFYIWKIVSGWSNLFNFDFLILTKFLTTHKIDNAFLEYFDAAKTTKEAFLVTIAHSFCRQIGHSF
jgi:hypothetical protein